MYKTIKLSVYSLFILIFLFLFTINASAEERLEYETTNDSIILEWEVDAEQVEVLNGKEEMKGEINYQNSTIKLDDLDQNTPYDLTVVYYDENNEVIDFDFIKVTTDKFDTVVRNTTNDENRLDDVSMDVAYVDGGVQLEWDEFPNDDDTYTIIKNDEEIGSTTEQSYFDDSVKNSIYYTYEISTKKSVSEDVLNERMQNAEETGIEITEEMEETMSYDYYRVSAKFRVPEETLNGHIQQMERYSTSDRWGIQYTTFIPDDKVKLNFLVYNNILGGDNRGFDVFNSNYRTRTAVFADFSNQRAQADPYMPGINSKGIHVGETVEYNKDGSEANTETQDEYVMQFSDLGTSSTASIFEVRHSVGIPITVWGISPPAIDYYYAAGLTNNFTPSGVISGYHDRAPNHEIALYQPQSDVALNVYEFNRKGFYNLMPITPPEYFSVRF